MMKYILMHREIEVAEIELDELSHITNIYEVYEMCIRDRYKTADH